MPKLDAMKKWIGITAILLMGALGFRLYLAIKLPSDEPDDGRVYALIARNVLEHHSYSVEQEEPYTPTYVRVPGYPLFLAGIYRVFGEDNNRAVRIAQAVLSTLICLVVGLLALAWAPADWGETRRRRALLIGCVAAAVCPFTAIYVSLILTETCATLLAAASVLAATLAMKSAAQMRRIWWWLLAGLLGGVATMFRPDAAMFVGAAGVLIVLVHAGQAISARRAARNEPASGWAAPLRVGLVSGTAISVGFMLALAPWTIRNAMVFQRFQPIAPSTAGMPGEFSYEGYISWLKTWVDDARYTAAAEWNLDYAPIRIEKIPDYAFDSPEEKAQVGALLAAYNKGVDAPDEDSGDDSGDDDDSGAAASDNGTVAGQNQSGQPNQPQPDQASASPTTAAPSPSPNPSPSPSTNKTHSGIEYDVEMTPELDAAFGEIARQRIARHPFRYYVVTRVKRAISLWFDTHSQYYPFQGELLPLSRLDTDLHQQYWLPAFMLLTLIYTGFGLIGCFILWRHNDARRWLLFLALLIVPRVAFLSTLENPEPRYVVELFVFVAAASAVALASTAPAALYARSAGWLARRRQRATSPASS
jgi:4-amino-4-deoxy-L-arabinose transferase-like glycosyltransferase